MPTMRVSHDRHHEWEVIRESEVQPGDHVAAANKAGEVARRTIVDWPGNFSLVVWPESEVERELAAREEAGNPTTRAALIAEYLAKVGLKHHVPHPNDVTFIEVIEDGENDPATLQGFLNVVFETKGQAAPDGGAPDPRQPAPVEAVAGEPGPEPVNAAPATEVQTIEQAEPVPDAWKDTFTEGQA